MIRLAKFRYALLALFTLSVALQSPVDASVSTFGTGLNQFEMTFVEIGNPGNDADPRRYGTPQGSVAYAYQLGKYEVSRDMITKYNANFGTNNGQAIDMGSMWRYGGTRDAMPATTVSWNAAARFVNWLNTSQGYQAAYNFTTSGVNDNIALWSPDQAWQQGGENLFRHKDAHYWLPSMDEWYKAAYYDPSSGNYLEYPTASNTAPVGVASGDGTGTNGNNEAVYFQYWDSGPADITQAGGLSAYGIMGMGGNVWEWDETTSDLNNDYAGNTRGVRGGYWNSSSFDLRSSTYRISGSAHSGGLNTGFRVAGLSDSANDVVPEPGSVLVWGLLGLAGVFVGRKWLRK